MHLRVPAIFIPSLVRLECQVLTLCLLGKWPQSFSGACPPDWPTFILPISSLNLPLCPLQRPSSFAAELCWNQSFSSSYPCKTSPASAPARFSLESEESGKNVFHWATFSEVWFSQPIGALRTLLKPGPDIYVMVSFLQSNVIYSLWHKNPKKMQFQHSLSWCEKMPKQPKKWLVVPPGSRVSFALEIQIQAEGGSWEGPLPMTSMLSVQNFTFVFHLQPNPFSCYLSPSKVVNLWKTYSPFLS